ADDVSTRRIALPNENERIVGGAVELYGGDFARLRERIPHRAVDLRSAAQAIGILYARIFFGRPVRLANLAAFIQMRKIAGGKRSPGIRTCVHDTRVESAGAAAQRIQRESSGGICRVNKDVGIAQS